MRQETSDAVQHAHQIDVEHPAPVVERDQVDAAAGGDAGIVADDMDIAERVERGFRGALDACGIGDVADGAADIRPDRLQAFDGGLQRFGFDIGEHHFHAVLRKRLAERQSDTGGATGHKSRLAGQVPHRFASGIFLIADHLYLHDRAGIDSEFNMTLPRIVVFDLDGTLVDTAPDLISALNYVLDREGLPPVPLKSARNMIGAGARKLIERGLEVEGRAMSTGDVDRLTRDFIDYYAAHIADISRPFHGLEGALDDLSARGYRFAVCTNKLEWLSKLLLDRLGMSWRFSAICGADTFGVSKPDPAILRQTIARAGGEPSAAIMVGDAGPDIGVARRAGIPVIGVEFGYTEVPIADLKPDRVISHMRELPAAVESLMFQRNTT
jgi:phosphoglycolate phosphatase